MRCMKSVKIFIITFIIIISATLKLLFAFIKRIYITLTLLNKFLQAIKCVKQTKNYLRLIFKYNREKRKEVKNKICLYNY